MTAAERSLSKPGMMSVGFELHRHSHLRRRSVHTNANLCCCVWIDHSLILTLWVLWFILAQHLPNSSVQHTHVLCVLGSLFALKNTQARRHIHACTFLYGAPCWLLHPAYLQVIPLWYSSTSAWRVLHFNVPSICKASDKLLSVTLKIQATYSKFVPYTYFRNVFAKGIFKQMRVPLKKKKKKKVLVH